MSEPLCTYQYYPKFKKICERLYNTDETKLIEELRSIFGEMDPIFQATWKFILHFFYVISQYCLQNNLNIKNLATIFSDILFKPSDMGINDMVMWRMFTDLLCLMIKENVKIFMLLFPIIEEHSIKTRIMDVYMVSCPTEEILSEASIKL